MKAGLATETVSMILRRGSNITPRPDTLRLLADALGGDFMHMMALAGHVDPPKPDIDIPPEIRARVDQLLSIWLQLLDTDPESAERLSGIAVNQAEMVLAAIRAGQRIVNDVEHELREEHELT